MAKDVHEIVVKVVQEKGKMTHEKAFAFVKKMEFHKRYSTDVWSWAGIRSFNSDMYSTLQGCFTLHTHLMWGNIIVDK